MKTKTTITILLLLALIIPLILTGCGNDKELQLNTPSYKADIALSNINITNVSCSGFSISFETVEALQLVVEWTVYPTDIFEVHPCTAKDLHHHNTTIETYPEGGTVVYRFTNMQGRGTEWLYQDLPRSDNPNAILPPPYYKGER